MKTSLSREHRRTLENTVSAARVDAEAGAEKLLAHSKELKKLIEKQSTEMIDAAIDLIMARASRSGSSYQPDPAMLRE